MMNLGLTTLMEISIYGITALALGSIICGVVAIIKQNIEAKEQD